MQVGVTFDRQQALDGAVDKREVADGGAFAVPVSYLPTATRAVYVVVEAIASSGATSATISGQSDLTLEAVYVAGDARGTDATPNVSGGDKVRAVFSRLDDGDETAVSEAITIEWVEGIGV